VKFVAQCSASAKVWQVTYNSGGAAAWKNSAVACNPQSWAANTWTHVQLAFSRVGSVISYDYVAVNGIVSSFNLASFPGGYSLGWGKVDLVDIGFTGAGASGSVVAYLDKLNVYRWSPVVTVATTTLKPTSHATIAATIAATTLKTTVVLATTPKATIAPTTKATTVTVKPAPAPTTPASTGGIAIAPNAVRVQNIQSLGSWQWRHGNSHS
jgi:hypothetical protein